jgi:hypothetical protein
VKRQRRKIRIVPVKVHAWCIIINHQRVKV